MKADRQTNSQKDIYTLKRTEMFERLGMCRYLEIGGRLVIKESLSLFLLPYINLWRQNIGRVETERLSFLQL